MTAHADLPAEFKLVAACCIWPPSERRNQAIRAQIGGTLDWVRVVRIARRHRNAALIRAGLAAAGVTVPSPQRDQIAAMADDIARKSLLLAGHSLAIQRACDEAGIVAMFVKGTALAMLAYGNLGLKQSWDIDLVVLPEQVPAVAALLNSLGYGASPPLPAFDSRQWCRWIEFGREYIFVNREYSTHVELHWKLLEHPAFLEGVTAASPSRLIDVAPGAGLRTFQDNDLFTYLCVHGAIHGWARLKWLADVAALVSADTEGAARLRLDAARKGHAEHCVAQAYLLCDRLFGTTALANIAAELRRSPRLRLLESVALWGMAAGRDDVMPGAGAFGELPISLSHFLLGRGAAYPARELWNKLNRPYDLLYSDRPALPNFLYPVGRILRWLARRGRMRPLPNIRRAQGHETGDS